MEFAEPYISGFTIYSKSGCHNCTKLKNILHEYSLFFLEIDCDKYLIEERDRFLSFIRDKTGKQITTFPIVFYEGKYIGGYNEAATQVEKLLVSFDE